MSCERLRLRQGPSVHDPPCGVFNGQSYQDMFVTTFLQNKKDGHFVEIGSNHPIKNNNTYILESKYNWRGLMVEYDSSFLPLYQKFRKNSIHEIGDARKVNYFEILSKNNFPEHIDYLQIDLDVNNRSTLDTLCVLENTTFDKYKFATVTFEHDIYSGNYFDTRKLSREIFRKNGYVLVFPDVQVFWEGKFQPYEDWYIHPEALAATPGALITIPEYLSSELDTTKSLTDKEIFNLLSSVQS